MHQHMASVMNTEIQSDTLRFVGFSPIVFRGEYDSRQAWMPFVDAVFIEQTEAPPHQVTNPRSKGDFVHVELIDRRLYHHEKGVAQPVLPFREHRRVFLDAQSLVAAEYPGWDRDSQGNLHTVKGCFDHKRNKRLNKWLKDNFVGRYHRIANTAVICERKEDADRLRGF